LSPEVERPRRRRLRAPQRRENLLDVAAALIEAHGIDKLRMETLAAAAGVSKPVAYDHFPDRSALIAALIERYSKRLLNSVGVELQNAAPGFEGLLRAATRGYFEAVAQHGVPLKSLWASVAGDPEVERLRQTNRERFIAVWAGLIQAEAGLRKTDATCLGAMLIASCEAAASEWSRGRISRKRAEELQVQSALSAIAALRVDR
jgi:AcrR family transcriptional regulator